jgi:hypothetical protein
MAVGRWPEPVHGDAIHIVNEDKEQVRDYLRSGPAWLLPTGYVCVV